MNLASLIWDTTKIKLLEALQIEDLNNAEIDIVISCYNGKNTISEPQELLVQTSRAPRKGEIASMSPKEVNPPSAMFYRRKPLGGGFVHSKNWTDIKFRLKVVKVDLRTWTIC